MNCYYLQSLKLCTKNEGIPYSLNDEQFDIDMESQDCAKFYYIVYSLEMFSWHISDYVHNINIKTR